MYINDLDKFTISSDSNYVALGTTINPNDSYTAPADGIYIFSLSTNAGGTSSMLYLDSDRTQIIARSVGVVAAATDYVQLPLKAGTTIYTRATGDYSVVAYIH